MPVRGVSAWGGPIYCDDDPIEFIDQWIRMSWAQTLCGRRFNESGDSYGWYFAHLMGIDSIRATQHERTGCSVVSGEFDVRVGVHTCPELSKLQPESVFELLAVETTLLFRAEIGQDADELSVDHFFVDPTTKDHQWERDRFGGPTSWYRWPGSDKID